MAPLGRLDVVWPVVLWPVVLWPVVLWPVVLWPVVPGRPDRMTPP
jgi:hypothetical protein